MAQEELQTRVWRRLSVVGATVYRLFYALVDDDQDAATTLIERLLAQDVDAPAGTSRAVELATENAYSIFELLRHIRDRYNFRWTNDGVRRGAHTLTRQRCPQPWRQDVLGVLDELPGDSGPFPFTPLHLQLWLPQLPNQLAALCCAAYLLRDMPAAHRKAARAAIDTMLAGAEQAAADPSTLGQRRRPGGSRPGPETDA